MKARVLTHYLPQFHPTIENDEWWGPGFTEWTNVAKAQRLFRQHKQPNLPGQLGFYDLRLEETRIDQASLARAAGIEGFLYYHYWFAGQRVLDRVPQEVLKSGAPDFPFALAWANQTWTGIWHGAPNRVLIEQRYPGRRDDAAHFDAVLPFFLDERYFRVEGAPLFYIYDPDSHPDLAGYCDYWRELASSNGLPGIYFVGEQKGLSAGQRRPSLAPLDAVVNVRLPPAITNARDIRNYASVLLKGGRYRSGRGPTTYSYRSVVKHFTTAVERMPDHHPCVIPNWDNTPRSARRGRVITETSPAAFQSALETAIQAIQEKRPERRLLFIKSWNEWAEGNYLEPDMRHGQGWLDAVKKAVLEF